MSRDPHGGPDTRPLPGLARLCTLAMKNSRRLAALRREVV
jgi:hypothetical protein